MVRLAGYGHKLHEQVVHVDRFSYVAKIVIILRYTRQRTGVLSCCLFTRFFPAAGQTVGSPDRKCCQNGGIGCVIEMVIVEFNKIIQDGTRLQDYAEF